MTGSYREQHAAAFNCSRLKEVVGFSFESLAPALWRIEFEDATRTTWGDMFLASDFESKRKGRIREICNLEVGAN